MQASSVQGLMSSQSASLMQPTHAPAEHMPVMPPAKVQLVPSGSPAWVQPITGSQPSAVHGFPSLQSIGKPG